MAAKHFDSLEVPTGKYLLVPESQISDLIGAEKVTQLLGLKHDEALTLSFLVRFYRFKTGTSKVKLAEHAKLSRHTITNIEDSPHHQVDIETLKSLNAYFSKNFGNGFRDALKVLGYDLEKI